VLGVILAMRLLNREKYEGLFAKLNSGATNSVGGTSERSDDNRSNMRTIGEQNIVSYDEK